MMTVRTGKYMIYKFYNKEFDITEMEFFLPDSNFIDTIDRLGKISDYKSTGFQIAGILYVDREAYLNARLAYRCEEYLSMDRYEREVREKFKRGEMSEDVLIRTLDGIKSHKMTILKQVHINFNRLVHYDYEIENELACALNDLYLKTLNI